MNVTEKQFRAYENVRKSGATKMFYLTNVQELSGLSKDTIIEIMKNYTTLCTTYPNVRKLE